MEVTHEPAKPRPQISFTGLFPRYPGKCKRLVNGVPCGKAFAGPPTRKFCDQHSANIRYRGV